jgi:bifunctional ADP-heptose synthase (sugar kinase/adenylyltransferase)
MAAGVVVGEVGTAPITVEKLTRTLRLQEREREGAHEEKTGTPRARKRTASPR